MHNKKKLIFRIKELFYNLYGIFAALVSLYLIIYNIAIYNVH